ERHGAIGGVDEDVGANDAVAQPHGNAVEPDRVAGRGVGLEGGGSRNGFGAAWRGLAAGREQREEPERRRWAAEERGGEHGALLEALGTAAREVRGLATRTASRLGNTDQSAVSPWSTGRRTGCVFGRM